MTTITNNPARDTINGFTHTWASREEVAARLSECVSYRFYITMKVSIHLDRAQVMEILRADDSMQYEYDISVAHFGDYSTETHLFIWPSAK